MVSVGSLVIARWRNNCWYPATVMDSRNNRSVLTTCSELCDILGPFLRLSVRYEDGDKYVVSLNHVFLRVSVIYSILTCSLRCLSLPSPPLPLPPPFLPSPSSLPPPLLFFSLSLPLSSPPLPSPPLPLSLSLPVESSQAQPTSRSHERHKTRSTGPLWWLHRPFSLSLVPYSTEWWSEGGMCL